MRNGSIWSGKRGAALRGPRSHRADSPGLRACSWTGIKRRRQDVLLPGGDAPELVVFLELQKIGWGKVADRTGRAYADVADACAQAMALTDHHDWITSAATRLILPGETLWQVIPENGPSTVWIKLRRSKQFNQYLICWWLSQLLFLLPSCGCRFLSDLLTPLTIK